MARELQPWSTAAAVEAAPEMGVPCLSSELQTWSTRATVEAVPEREVLACREELQTWSTAVAVEAVPEMEVRCEDRSAEPNTGASSLWSVRAIQRLMGTETVYV